MIDKWKAIETSRKPRITDRQGYAITGEKTIIAQWIKDETKWLHKADQVKRSKLIIRSEKMSDFR